MSELKEFQKKVIANAQNVKGLKVGDKAPDFSLPNALNENVSLSDILKAKKVVIKFYRGEWCPICNLDLKAVQNVLPEIESLGATLIAISPQNPDSALSTTQKNELGFEVLSDSNQEVIKAYNLQFDPGDDYHSRRDLTKENGNNSKTLPIPATFIIGQNGIIRACHVEADYTTRMSALDIIKALESFK